MITKAQRERLYQFFAGYFHEDWSVEADSPDQVLSAFVRQRGGGCDLEELSRSIVAFVREYPKDDEIDEALFKELGCYYSPRAEGILTRSWLLSVAAKLDPPSDP